MSVVRRSGGLHVVDTMNHFLHITESFLVGVSYWNMVHGLEPGDVERDEEALRFS